MHFVTYYFFSSIIWWWKNSFSSTNYQYKFTYFFYIWALLIRNYPLKPFHPRDIMISAFKFPHNTIFPRQPGANAPGNRDISARWAEIHESLEHFAQKKFTWEIGNRGNVETPPPTLYQTTLLFQLFSRFKPKYEIMILNLKMSWYFESTLILTSWNIFIT